MEMRQKALAQLGYLQAHIFYILPLDTKENSLMYVQIALH